jgi:hypothetical protein
MADRKDESGGGEPLDKLLLRLDGVVTRLDALEVGGGSKNPVGKKDAAKADGGKKADEEEDKDKEEKSDEEEDKDKEEKADEEPEDKEKAPPPVAADKKKDAKKDALPPQFAKKDGEEEGKIPPVVEKKDGMPPQFAKKDEERSDERADAVSSLQQTVDRQSREIARLTGMMKPRSDEEHARMAEIQSQADSVFMGFGKKAPRPLEGESADVYDVRLATYLKPHSKRWAKVKLSSLGGEAFAIAKEDIYNDAAAAANHPVDIPEGELREVTREDPRSGLRTTYFYGDSFIRGMGMPCRKVKGGVPGIRTDFRTH